MIKLLKKYQRQGGENAQGEDRKKHQVTIPKEVFERLDLEKGECLEVKAEEGKVVLIPQETIPRDQAWFWKEEWQKRSMKPIKILETENWKAPLTRQKKRSRH